MKVRSLRAVLLEVAVASGLEGLTVTSTLPPGLEGSPENGESLGAQSTPLGGSMVMVGTEDGEALSGRLPWARRERGPWSLVEHRRDGLTLSLGRVPAKRHVGLHFLVAENDFPEKVAGSAWFAVDRPHEDLLLDVRDGEVAAGLSDPVDVLATSMGLRSCRRGRVIAFGLVAAMKLVEACQARGILVSGVDVFQGGDLLEATGETADFSSLVGRPGASNAAADSARAFIQRYQGRSDARFGLTLDAGPAFPYGWARTEAGGFIRELVSRGLDHGPWTAGVPGPEWQRAICRGPAFDVLVQYQFWPDDAFESWEWLLGFADEGFWTVPAAARLWLEGTRWPSGHGLPEENEWLLSSLGSIAERVRETGVARAIQELGAVYEVIRAG